MITDHSNFTDVETYASGNEKMIQSSLSHLMRLGLPRSQFFSDAFVATS